MKTTTTTLIASSLASAAFAVTLVVACSDDSPPPADAQDAAVCDCPAAEPPLQGRIVPVVVPDTVPPMDIAIATAQCQDGGILLGGGCREVGLDGRIVIRSAGPMRIDPNRPGFHCSWLSTSPAAINVEAEAICLMPAQ